MSELTPAQRYLLQWIQDHESYQQPNHPDGLRRLDVPPERRKGMGWGVLKVLKRNGYIESNGEFGFRAIWRITDEGRKALRDAEQP